MASIKQAIYTHGYHESSLRLHEWRTVANSVAYIIPHLKPNLKVLDVGCGPGTITLDIASTYVPNGHVTGLEYSEEVVERARKHASTRGVTNVEFLAGDAHALPFPDDTFDITHAHQVLQHIADPVLALKEMRRVTKPGGVVASRESDRTTFVWFPESEEMTEWASLYDRVARGNGGEPNAGRRLKFWARQAGYDVSKITCSAGTWLYSTPEERAWWGGTWAERIVKSDFAKGAAKHGATVEDLNRLSQGWKTWAADEDGWFALMHGEMVCMV